MGLYDDGYKESPCFWGKEPASLVKEAVKELKRGGYIHPLKAIDLGCGEGKNTAYIAENGFNVVGIDQSEFAIINAHNHWPNLSSIFLTGDMRYISGPKESFDLVVSTGSIHCLQNQDDVELVINNIKNMLKKQGFVVFSAFNSGKHDFSGHPNTFNPILLNHNVYLQLFSGLNLIHSSDQELIDVHPNNNIVHHHSITRIMAQKL